MTPSGRCTRRGVLRLRHTIASPCSCPSSASHHRRFSSHLSRVSYGQKTQLPYSSASCRTFTSRRFENSVSPWIVPASSHRRRLSTEPSQAPATSSSSDDAPSVTVTDACAERLVEMAAADGKPKVLRVCVEGGGCAGFQYKFEFDDNVTKFDTVFAKNDQKVVVDDVSLEYLKGSTINFTTEMIRSAFTVEDNPNSEAGCGCGESFTPKGV